MKLVPLLICLGLSNTIFAEYFSSTAQLRKLLEYVRKSEVTTYLDDVISYHKSRLNYLKLLHEGLGDLQHVTNELSGELKHPLDALTYAKSADYLQSMGTITNDVKDNLEFNKTVVLEYMTRLPTSIDLEGSAVAIITIQEVHQLPLQDIADGILKGHKSTRFTAQELKDIAHAAPNAMLWTVNDRWYASVRALEVLKIALMRANHSDAYSIYKTFAYLVDILECTCTTFYHEYVSKMLDLNPELEIPNICVNITKSPCYNLNPDSSMYPKNALFKAMCRGEKTPPVQFDEPVNYVPAYKLKCRLVHNNDPRLILSPEKIEELSHFNPRITIIHDLIDARYVEFFKDEATDKLSRGTTNLKEGTVRNYHKVSQQYLLPKKYRRSKMKHLRTRISALTQLRLTSFEDILVVNYACGGMYAVHTDVFTLSIIGKTYTNGMSNRLVTIVIYLNEVDDGGETVFPYMGIRVAPIKYAALMFFNMKRSMDVNYLASHSSCPVIHGEKWIANQWIINHGQEFTHPCLLDKTL